MADPAVLVEQGYAVFSSANRRVAYWATPTEEDYRHQIARRAADPHTLIIVGLIDGQLGGYLESYAVNGILYTHQLVVASEALETGISTGLYVETIQIAARTGAIGEACVGLHTPEVPDLCAFKAGMGFRVVHVPARVSILAPISADIGRRRPAAHYHLVGLAPSAGMIDV